MPLNCLREIQLLGAVLALGTWMGIDPSVRCISYYSPVVLSDGIRALVDVCLFFSWGAAVMVVGRLWCFSTEHVCLVLLSWL